MQKNLYGDDLKPSASGYGVDIASQRADDLDQMALEYISTRKTRTKALDLACGHGGQALRMAAAGADVVASDIVDYAMTILPAANTARNSMEFVQEDMRCLPGRLLTHGPFNVIVCQRAMHYLSYSQARSMVANLHQLLHKGGRLYLSASGLRSELGMGYPHVSHLIEARYAPLAPDMEQKHGIKGAVCLYETEELTTMLRQTGFTVLLAFASSFGNVKIVAERTL